MISLGKSIHSNQKFIAGAKYLLRKGNHYHAVICVEHDIDNNYFKTGETIIYDKVILRDMSIISTSYFYARDVFEIYQIL